jgi:hypothetical protein
MATFYKYKERDDISKSMIDWSGLTKQISDNLISERDRRNQLKQELEEDQLNKIKAVEEFTQGLDPSMNQAMMKVSQQYKDYLLTRHRLMKQGLVSVNDTKIKKQGAIDTFDSINNAAKQYNEKMAKYIETGGNLNDFAVQDTAEILNIADSQLVIDDMGRGTFIKVDENGNEIAMPANSFATIMDDVFDRFDDDLEFAKATENIAKIQIAKSGYFNVTDFRQSDEYDEWLTNKTKEILNTDKRVAEVAADLLGIEATRDKEEAKEKGLVLFEYKNGKRSVNVDYVKDKVKQAVQNGLNSRLDYIEERTPYRPSATEIEAEAGKKADQEVSSLIEKFVVNADFSALKSALAQKGFQGSTAPDEKGIIRLIDSNGKSLDVETKGRTAKQVGQEIAGFLKVGEYFKDRNITANLNTGVTAENNKSKYGIFVSVPTQNFDTVENRTYVYDKLTNSMGIELEGDERSREIAQRMQNIVGNKADITYQGDAIIINGTTVVANGINNAAKVFSAIDNISTKQKPNKPTYQDWLKKNPNGKYQDWEKLE